MKPPFALAAAAILLLILTTITFAREATESPAASGNESTAVDSHPTLSTNIRWVRPVLAAIVIMFVLAILVGPVVRKEVPQEMPPVHSHDEPPGASGHHGPGGTADPNAPDAHHHSH